MKRARCGSGRVLAFTVVAVVLSVRAPLAQPQTVITDPGPWVLVQTSSATVSGTYAPMGNGPRRGELIVRDASGDLARYALEGTNGRWSVSDVQLAIGVNQVSALVVATGNHTMSIVRAPRAEPHARGKQGVVLKWTSGVDGRLASLASRTVQSATPAEVGGFAPAVRRRTEELMSGLLRDFAIALTDVGAPGAHIVEFSPELAEGLFGATEPDCGNVSPFGVSHIYVGTLAHEFMIDWTWGPARPTDSLVQRVEDVAHALSRTATHELLHGLGLMACVWMGSQDGEDSYHPNPVPPLDEGAILRFGMGLHLMDSGRFVPGTYRIGEASEDHRGPTAERLLTPFDRAYLSLIHPKTEAPH